MKLLKTERLFFGCKIDSKLREALALAKPGDRRYFEDPANTEFLRVLQFEEERWIGKIIPGGVQISEVDDIQRNIVSILRRIAPNVRTTGSSLKIFALASDGDAAQVIDDVEPDDEIKPEADGDGPYIEY